MRTRELTIPRQRRRKKLANFKVNIRWKGKDLSNEEADIFNMLLHLMSRGEKR